MDIGTSFGGIGASREMMIASLAEPAMLMIVFSVALLAGSTQLSTIAAFMEGPDVGLRVTLGLALVALVIVALAENARIPVDNPATHLELTMIHEALLLEYSARHLALMEWASALKLFNYTCIGLALFAPWGIGTSAGGPLGLLAAWPLLAAKLLLAGAGLALVETLSAKLRVFRAPEFLATAFLLAVLGILVHLLLGS
jgi:formate hydrogenlyase subunit 4